MDHSDPNDASRTLLAFWSSRIQGEKDAHDG